MILKIENRVIFRQELRREVKKSVVRNGLWELMNNCVNKFKMEMLYKDY